MYYLFKTCISDQDHYTVTNETERTFWCKTSLEAYKDLEYRDVNTFSKVNLNCYLENFTLISSSEDITTLSHSCPELLL